jgi:hypothetical protein
MPEDNVVQFPGITFHDIPVDQILDGAKAAKLTKVTIFGETENGDVYIASSVSYLPDMLWDIEQAKMSVLTAGQEEQH